MGLSITGIILLIGTLSLSDAAKWGYIGDTGVRHWASLFPEACSGDFQSPIDIDTERSIYDPRLRQFSIFYDPPVPGSKFVVLNNGHSIQVNTEGKFFVTNGGLHDIYSTAQFHFHWGHKSHHGSEHTLDGVASPIEMHIVNWNSDQFASISEAVTKPAGLAVLGIMFKLSEKDNPILEPLVQVLMHVRDPDMKLRAEIPAVSMNSFLPPAAHRYFRYNGSLTTPGCFESVIWTVFSEKQTISRRQLHVFRQVLKPSQKTHKRHVEKRSTNQRKVVDAVMEELGLEGNTREAARFRRQLEEKNMAQTGTTVEATGNAAANTRHSPESSHQQPEPVPVKSAETGPKYDTHSDKKNMDNLRKMLVNNFRPIQPLNGRTVYRSFPFLNEPLMSKTEVVYVDIDNSDANGAGTLAAISGLTVVCGVMSLLWH